jgi:hypothetical protein
MRYRCDTDVICDTSLFDASWIGDSIYSGYGEGWGGPIVGADKCIYWPPTYANHLLKFDPETQQLPSLVGDNLGTGNFFKWQNGALATDGAIYCFPSYFSRVLVIDPFKECSATLQTNIKLYPDELGRLFLKDSEEEECDATFFESSFQKFRSEKVFQVNLLKNASPWMRMWNGLMARIMATFHHSW